MNSFEKIYAVVRRIPKGKVASYGQIAELAGNPRWSRVVGYALHVNPDPENIPCYRVVTKDGRLSPAFAFGGENVQRRLLEADGIEFDGEGRVIMEKYRMTAMPAITIKAVFVDFYGTLVHEDGVQIEQTARIVSQTGDGSDTGVICSFWWERFKQLFEASKGDSFRTQRELEYISLRDTLKHFGSDEDAARLCELMFDYWVRPDIFPDTKEFLEKCPVPVCVVSNIDTGDVMAAIKHHGLSFAGVVSSEDARAYKPAPEIFRRALDLMGCAPEDVLHVGDSLSSDAAGARAAGIEPVWLNRRAKPVPEGVRSAASLTDVLSML